MELFLLVLLIGAGVIVGGFALLYLFAMRIIGSAITEPTEATGKADYERLWTIF